MTTTPPEPDWIKTGLTFFGLFLMYKVDFTDENNVLMIRILFGVSQVLTFLLMAYLYLVKINPIPEGGPKIVKSVPKASFMETPDPTNVQYMSVKEYDLSQLKSLLTSTATTIAITLFIHVKFAIVPPLLMQALLGVSSLYGNPLVQAYVLNKTLPRPFPEPPGLFSGLSSAFSGGEENKKEKEEDILEVEDQDQDENEQENQDEIEDKKQEKKQDKKQDKKKQDKKQEKKQDKKKQDKKETTKQKQKSERSMEDSKLD